MEKCPLAPGPWPGWPIRKFGPSSHGIQLCTHTVFSVIQCGIALCSRKAGKLGKLV